MRMSKSYILTSHSIYTGPERISFKLFSKKLKNHHRRFCKDSKILAIRGIHGAMSFLGQDVVNHAVFQRLGGGHPVVAVYVGEDLVERLPGALGDNLAELGARLLNLLGGNKDVRSLALGPAQRLVDQDAGVGERQVCLSGRERLCW